MGFFWTIWTHPVLFAMYHRLDVDQILNLEVSRWYSFDRVVMVNQPTLGVENQLNEQQISHIFFAAWPTMVDMMTGTRGHSFPRWSCWRLRKYPWCVVSRSFKIYVPVACNHSKHKRNQKSLGLQLGCSPSQVPYVSFVIFCRTTLIVCGSRFQTRIWWFLSTYFWIDTANDMFWNGTRLSI